MKRKSQHEAKVTAKKREERQPEIISLFGKTQIFHQKPSSNEKSIQRLITFSIARKEKMQASAAGEDGSRLQFLKPADDEVPTSVH